MPDRTRTDTEPTLLDAVVRALPPSTPLSASCRNRERSPVFRSVVSGRNTNGATTAILVVTTGVTDPSWYWSGSPACLSIADRVSLERLSSCRGSQNTGEFPCRQTRIALVARPTRERNHGSRRRSSGRDTGRRQPQLEYFHTRSVTLIFPIGLSS